MKQKQGKLVLVQRVKDKIAKGEFYVESCTQLEPEDRKALQEQFRKAYIQKYVAGCCCPAEWIGDDVMKAIIAKFKYVLHAVIGRSHNSNGYSEPPPVQRRRTFL